jgi:hypothetical protein
VAEVVEVTRRVLGIVCLVVLAVVLGVVGLSLLLNLVAELASG